MSSAAPRSALALGALVLLSYCAAPAPSPPPAAPTEAWALEFQARCRADCERRRQMQAVAIEVIQAGCRADCEAAWASPLARDTKTLAAHVGAWLRALGRLETAGEGLVLRLEDGVVPIATDAAELPAHVQAGASVLVWGSVAEGEAGLRLEPVSLVMPTAPPPP